ncbi:MAG: biopolymer transporter ExbD [Halobacteriovoraceae bacterium]|nr:biopolymer transporter ExbD [Halobacteriovoraceae bacterium]MCB9093982.1 biopolymer transporter ExbD [Halobacteriovoraceae bacterium]
MGIKNTDSDEEVLAEINVTPLVDVMLVLLVIFMISAPLMFNGINLTLPKTKKVQGVQLKKEQIILSINRAGEYFLDEQRVLRSELIDFIKKLMAEKKTESVFIRADTQITYGEVAKAMSYLKNSGITNISLITDIEDE